MAAAMEKAIPSLLSEGTLPIPGHVPPGLVFDFDFFAGPEFTYQPHQSLTTELRQRPDIFYTPRNGGHWVIGRMEDAGELVQDPATFSSNPAVSGGAVTVSLFKRIPIDQDPPEHAEYRKLLNSMLSPAAVRLLETKVEAFARDLVASVAAKGECEFMSEIAKRYSTGIFIELLGIPLELRETFVEWVDLAVRTADPAVSRQAYAKIASLMDETLEMRRAQPGDDLLSKLLTKTIGGCPLDQEELRGIGIVLFVGGLDTVVSLLAFIIQFLAEHPDHVRQLRAAPEDLPNALEELIRRNGINNLYRHIQRDTCFKGVNMKAGERVLLLYSVYGIDDRNVADPLTVDFSRPVSRHMTFGAGPHRCLGSHLARLELRMFLQEWLAAIPEFQLRPGPKLTHHGGKVMQLVSLPLIWPVATRVSQ
jgi:cytochrome P450